MVYLIYVHRINIMKQLLCILLPSKGTETQKKMKAVFKQCTDLFNIVVARNRTFTMHHIHKRYSITIYDYLHINMRQKISLSIQ